MDQRNAAGAGSFETAKALDDTYVMNTYGRLPVEFVRGSGAELADSAGKTYLDFLGGIGAASLGHANPVVARAVKDQLDRVWQVGNYFYVENRGELAQALSELLSTTTDEVGHPTGSTGSTWKTFFSNSGAESNEGAIKVARRWGERKLDGAATIVTARKSFHGRTLATLAATGQDVFHKSFRPLPEGFCSVPLNDLAALDQALGSTSACAVMLECVQGEGGVWPADPDYLRGVRELCDGHGVLLVIDEVQTGFFRCGAPFSYQLAGIEPDVVSMAKGIGGGFPMGAVAAREKCADLLAPGDHGSTFGGNALAAAAGRATLQQMAELDIGEHVIEVGAHLAERLAKLPHVSEVRGHGLMRGAQLDVPIATPIVERGLERGLVLNHIGDSILRFLPPLVITSEQIDAAMDELERLIGQMA
ncbi:acetylornithine/succinylornithine family transaminase [Parafannyhessea umbonata]|uniref:Acetylornithine aminotransferase n=1 Tax=Parafannyhessea umbonata TaxID=604330 RepID=A0A1H9N9I2_9ACTN|nr:acetylornithine/succinylornithine family transaminase [Parafannyhessea umbonata]SER32572.1 acetylornithine aminotransferase [Parafannyhessea umbonata]